MSEQLDDGMQIYVAQMAQLSKAYKLTLTCPSQGAADSERDKYCRFILERSSAMATSCAVLRSDEHLLGAMILLRAKVEDMLRIR